MCQRLRRTVVSLATSVLSGCMLLCADAAAHDLFDKTSMFSRPEENPLCGPQPDLSTCPAALSYVKFFNTPINAVHEDGSPVDWMDSLAGGHNELRPRDKLILFIVAELQLYGIVHQPVDEFNYSVHLNASGKCETYYSFPSPIRWSGSPAGIRQPYNVSELTREFIAKNDLESCALDHLAEFRDFPSSSEGKKLIELYSFLDTALDSVEGRSRLRKLFLLLGTRKTDLSFHDVMAAVRGQPLSEYNHLYPFCGCDRFGSMVVPPSLSLAPARERTSLGAKRLYRMDGHDNTIAFSASTTLGDRPFPRSKASFYFADGVRLADHVSVVAERATDSSRLGQEGASIVLIANRIVVGRDGPNPAFSDAFGGFLSYPEAIFLSPAVRLAQNAVPQYVRSPDVLGPDPDIIGRGGTLAMVAQSFRLTRYAAEDLRRSIDAFGNVLTNEGSEPFVVNHELASACLAGLSAENPNARELRDSAQSGLGAAAFLPLWERALQWEMENNPSAVLHKYVYVPSGSGEGAGRTGGGHDGFQMVEPFAAIEAHNDYEHRFIPDSALDKWLVRQIQDAQLDLNVARANRSAVGIVNAVRSLNEVASGVFSPSGDPAALDSYNQHLQTLLDARDKIADALTLRHVVPPMSGEAGRVVMSVSTLAGHMVPTRLELTPIRVGNRDYVGKLGISAVDNRSVTLNLQGVLVANERTFNEIKAVLEEEGVKLVGTLEDWKVTVERPDIDGISAFEATVSGQNRVSIDMTVTAERANDLLWQIATSPGLALKFKWSSVVDPSVKGEFDSYFSLTYRDSLPLSVSGRTLKNIGPSELLLDYIDLGDGSFEDINPAAVLAPGVSLTVPALPVAGKTDVRVTSQGVRFITANPYAVSDYFWNPNQGSLVRKLTVTSLVSPIDPELGVLDHLDVHVVYQSDASKPETLDYGMVRLSGAGTAGAAADFSVVTPIGVTPSVQVDGMAVYKEGSKIPIKTMSVNGLTISIGQSDLSSDR